MEDQRMNVGKETAVLKHMTVAELRAVGRDPAVVAETIRQARAQADKRIRELQAELSLIHI